MKSAVVAKQLHQNIHQKFAKELHLKYSKEHMFIYGLSIHHGTTDSRKNLDSFFSSFVFYFFLGGGGVWKLLASLGGLHTHASLPNRNFPYNFANMRTRV